MKTLSLSPHICSRGCKAPALHCPDGAAVQQHGPVVPVHDTLHQVPLHPAFDNLQRFASWLHSLFGISIAGGSTLHSNAVAYQITVWCALCNCWVTWPTMGTGAKSEAGCWGPRGFYASWVSFRFTHLQVWNPKPWAPTFYCQAPLANRTPDCVGLGTN